MWYSVDDSATSRVVVIPWGSDSSFSSLASPSVQQLLCAMYKSRRPTATALRQHNRVGGARRNGWGWDWGGCRWVEVRAEGEENEAKSFANPRLEPTKAPGVVDPGLRQSLVSREARGAFLLLALAAAFAMLPTFAVVAVPAPALAFRACRDGHGGGRGHGHVDGSGARNGV